MQVSAAYFCILYETLICLSPLRFHWVGGCWIEHPTVANAGQTSTEKRKNKREGRELAIYAVIAVGGTNSND